MKVAVLAGGLGGSRFARALAETIEPEQLTIVGNVGDDVEIFGVHVSPDLDTILYTLTGRLDEERGWGRKDETWNALGEAGGLGADTWFQLGDRDLGLHLVRTQKLRDGEPLSRVTRELAAAFGLVPALLPATDDRLRTWLETPAGDFPFQEWFVGRQHRDEVDAVRFEGAEDARPAPGVLEALAGADLIAIAPSNPFVSIGPILAVAGIREALEQRSAPAVAVSPLIGGKAVRGPAARMLARLAGGTGPKQVTDCYKGLIDALVIDVADADEDAGIRTIVTRTLMNDADARRRLIGRSARDRGGLAVKIAIVGGTGTFGRALARKLHLLGEDVYIGSRDAQRAKERALEIGVKGDSNENVVKGVDLVVLATKSNAAIETGTALADAIGDTPVLCVASDLRFTEIGIVPGLEEGSLAENLAKLIRAPVASGLQTVSAIDLSSSEPPDQDALICGDDPGVKKLVLELAGRLVGGRAVDVGPLANSRALEGMTAVILNVNKEFGVHAGLRLTGLP